MIAELQLEIVAAILFIQMVFMTIEGDLKDLDVDEPCIPRALGVEVHEAYDEMKVLVISKRFLALFAILSVVQSVLIISLALSHSWQLAVATMLPAAVMTIVSFSMVKDRAEYSPKRIKKRIVIFTCLFVISLGLASISYLTLRSVIALIAGPIAWGLFWQDILFGDAGYFA